MSPGSRIRFVSCLFAAISLAGIACIGAPEDLEGIHVRLTLPSGTSIDSVHYTIHSAQPTSPPPDRQGDVNTSNPQSQVSLEVSYPASAHDTVALTATTADGAPCAGTSPEFSVVAGAQAAVDITLTCTQIVPGGGPGSVRIDTDVVDHTDICPVIGDFTVAPIVAFVGDSISVSASASDGNPGDHLRYAWTSTDGASPSAFAAPTALDTQYVCPARGTFTLTLTVTDDHATPCSTHVDVVVTCKRLSCASSGVWADGSGNKHDAVLKNFGAGSGLAGDGSPGNPYAMTFDGVDDYAELLAGADGLRITDEVSEEFWLKYVGAATGSSTIFSNRDGTTDVSGFSANIVNGKWTSLETVDGASFTTLNDGVVTNGAWSHFVVSFSASQGIARLYINGVFMAHGPLLDLIKYSANAVPRLGEKNGALPFKGQIGMARVWVGAIMPTEAVTLFRQGAPAYGISAPAPTSTVARPIALQLDASSCVGD